MESQKIFFLFLVVVSLGKEHLCVGPKTNSNGRVANRPAVMFPRINPSTSSSATNLNSASNVMVPVSSRAPPNSLLVSHLGRPSSSAVHNIPPHGQSVQNIALHTPATKSESEVHRTGAAVLSGQRASESHSRTETTINTQPQSTLANTLSTDSNRQNNDQNLVSTASQVPPAVTTSDLSTEETDVLNQKKDSKKNICKKVDTRRCFTYINEVLPSKRLQNTFTEKQFIEIVRTCRRDANLNKKDILDGYLILIIDLSRKRESSTFHGNLSFYADISGKKMLTRPDESRENGVNFYYTVGTLQTSNTKLSARAFPVQHLSGQLEGFGNAISAEDNFPKLVMLLHVNKREQTVKFFSQFNLNKHLKGNYMLPRVVTPDLIEIIRPRLMDMFVYGRQCSTVDAEIIKKFYPNFPSDCGDFITSWDAPSLNSENSYSKCFDDEPFNGNTFKTAPATPGLENSCHQPETETEIPFSLPESFYPFSFRHRILEAQSQKLILNLWSSLKNVKLYPEILEGYPQDVASKLTGVNTRTISRANQRHRNNVISTPGKKRKASSCRAIVKLDTFDQEKIRKMLQEGFARGLAYTASELREIFLILIVMDNASYHSSRLHPKKSDSKRTMYDWLKSYEHIRNLHITLPEFNKIRKWELQVIIDQVVINPLMEGELYSIDKMAKDRGFEIIRLPPYHCHFSPIEYSWKDVKHNTRKRNTMQNLDLVKEIVENELKEYSPELAKKHFAHVQRLEEEAWVADGLFEENEFLNRIVIPVGDASESDDDDQEVPQNLIDDDVNDNENDQYLDWANDVLQVVMDDTDERIETDGTLHLIEECDDPNDAYDIENEMSQYMNRNPKRVRSEPLMISRIMHSENTRGN